MRASHNGEGGTFPLMSLIMESRPDMHWFNKELLLALGALGLNSFLLKQKTSKLINIRFSCWICDRRWSIDSCDLSDSRHGGTHASQSRDQSVLVARNGNLHSVMLLFRPVIRNWSHWNRIWSYYAAVVHKCRRSRHL